jgi:predicted glutamine amidotransferase
MCGIAGYNASKEFAAKHLTEKRMRHVLEEAWLHNQHRGSDAAGYFRLDLEDGKPYTRKARGSASVHLENSADQLVSPAFVFGAHTRAATQGPAEENENNHPVVLEDTIVTHNGGIGNDETIKRQHSSLPYDKIPEVDSAAINVMLNTVKDPRNIAEVADALDELVGGYAIHGVWKSHPGLSLLARGRTSPLTLRWHPDGIVLYASEDEAIYHMILAMGLDPADKDWQIRKLDDFTQLLVEDGQVIAWNKLSNGWTKRAKMFVKRLNPWKPGKPTVVRTDDLDYWATERLNRSAHTSKTKIIYDKGQFKEKNKSFPATTHNNVMAALSEATTVRRSKRDSQLLFAQFGNVEVVVDGATRKILDVYDFDTHPEAVRFEEEEKAVVASAASNIDFDKFMIAHMTRVVSPTTSPVEPRYKAGVKNVGKPKNHGSNQGKRGNKRKDNSGLPNPTTGAVLQRTGPVTGTDTSDQEPFVVELSEKITWDNLGELFEHSSKPFVFLENLMCTEHKSRYMNHTFPERCGQVKAAAMAALSCLSDVSLYYALFPDEEIVERLPEKEEDHCRTKNERCEYETYLWRQVIVDTDDNLAVDIPVGEMCIKCGAKYFIRNLPAWIEHSEKGRRQYVS